MSGKPKEFWIFSNVSIFGNANVRISERKTKRILIFLDVSISDKVKIRSDNREKAGNWERTSLIVSTRWGRKPSTPQNTGFNRIWRSRWFKNARRSKTPTAPEGQYCYCWISVPSIWNYTILYLSFWLKSIHSNHIVLYTHALILLNVGRILSSDRLCKFTNYYVILFALPIPFIHY